MKGKEIMKNNDIFNYRRSFWGEVKYFFFYSWWNKVSLYPLKIKSFIQRGKRGWADEDTWDLDIYLSKVISESVNHLAQNMQGCPSQIWQVYEQNKLLTEKQKDELSLKEWINILKDIRNGFKIVPKMFDVQVLKNKKFQKYQQLKLKKAFELLQKHYFSLWD